MFDKDRQQSADLIKPIEDDLVNIATHHFDDEVSSAAMLMLRRMDIRYHFCADSDGLAEKFEGDSCPFCGFDITSGPSEESDIPPGE